MSTQSPGPGSRPAHPSRPHSNTAKIWIVVGVLLAVGVVVPIRVGTYDSEAPELAGFPFFYWFQFLLIPVVSALTYLAFRLSQVATARDRAARGVTRRQP
jgi:hypothetical protein